MLTHAQARLTFAPFMSTISESFWGARQEYDRLDADLVTRLSLRTQSSIKRDLIVSQLQVALDRLEGVTTKSYRGLLVFLFGGGRIAARVKKLGPTLLVRASKTRQSEGYLQQELPEMPEPTARVQLGYITQIGVSIAKAFIVLQVGSKVEWAIEVPWPGEDAAPVQPNPDPGPIQPSRGRRVRPRANLLEEHKRRVAAG
jgi:hypothetical protein